MKYLSIWMLVSECGGKGRMGELATKLYISSLCIEFYYYVHMYHYNNQLTV